MKILYVLHGPSCIGKTTLLEKIKDDHIHKIEIDDCLFWAKAIDTSDWDSLHIEDNLKNELLTYDFDPVYLKKIYSTKKDKYLVILNSISSFLSHGLPVLFDNKEQRAISYVCSKFICFT